MCGIFYKGYHKSSNIRLTVIKLENGWGYDINNNQRILIHQPNIPAIQKSIPFNTKQDARKVGSLVLKKIESNKFPTITLRELDSLKIDYPKN